MSEGRTGPSYKEASLLKLVFDNPETILHDIYLQEQISRLVF